MVASTRSASLPSRLCPDGANIAAQSVHAQSRRTHPRCPESRLGECTAYGKEDASSVRAAGPPEQTGKAANWRRRRRSKAGEEIKKAWRPRGSGNQGLSNLAMTIPIIPPNGTASRKFLRAITAIRILNRYIFYIIFHIIGSESIQIKEMEL